MPRARRGTARRRRGEAGLGARDAAARGARRQGARPEEAEVDRGLAPEDRLARRAPRRRPRRRRRRPRPPAHPALLARRPGPVHHAPRGHHAGPAHGHAQRRHVPDAEARPPLDGDALAAAQGRAHGLHGRERPARRLRRARPRPRRHVLRERAAPEAHRRVHARRLPQGRAGRARQVQDERPARARECGDRARGLRGAGRRDARGPVRRPHGLLLGRGAVPGLPRDRDDDALGRDLSVDRRRQAAGRGRVAGQGDRADLPARDPDERPRDRRLRPSRSPARSTTA